MAYGPAKKLQMQRTTMWLPRDMLAQIDAISERIGLSRTRFVDQVLRDSVFRSEVDLGDKRSSMLVPRGLLTQIDARAEQIGVSRTRFVERVLRDSVGRAEADLRDMILAPKEMPDDRQLDFLA